MNPNVAHIELWEATVAAVAAAMLVSPAVATAVAAVSPAVIPIKVPAITVVSSAMSFPVVFFPPIFLY